MKVLTTVLAICLIGAQAVPNRGNRIPGLKSFSPLHLRSYAQQVEATSRAAPLFTSCYSDFTVQINDLADATEAGNQRCETVFEEAQAEADAQLEADRNNLDTESGSIQSSLQTCESTEGAEAAVNCYISTGQSSVSPVSDLTLNARGALRTFNNAITFAQIENTGCSADVAGQSEKIANQMYGNLNTCLVTGEYEPVVIPEFGTESTTEAPIETTTEEPETEEPVGTTTEEPETEEPVGTTTEEPETEEPVGTTTEEPETEEPVGTTTEEPETEEPVGTTTEEPGTEEPVGTTTEEPETEEPVGTTTEEPETEEPVGTTTEEPETEEPVGTTTEEPETEEPEGTTTEEPAGTTVDETEDSIKSMLLNKFRPKN